MKIGIALRNMGPQSTPGILADAAKFADTSGLGHLWVLDHIAIPPDDSKGSEGRYVDPLATLAFLSGITKQIQIGTSVLVLPYRERFMTAKLVASIQELSGERLLLGVGTGWMESEFKAVGKDIKKRGADTDKTIDFINHCFENHIVVENGQEFIFSPRPKRPPLLIGGNSDKALDRALQRGDGWMPMIKDDSTLITTCLKLKKDMLYRRGVEPIVIPLKQLDLDDLDKSVETLQNLKEAGCSGVEHFQAYETLDEFKHITERLLEIKNRAQID